MRIIDCHCHIYPNKIAPRAVKAIGDFYDIPMNEDGTTDTLLTIGSAAGVTDFVVHSVATTPHQVQSVNEFVSSQVKLHPHRLIGFGTMHPQSEDVEADFKHLLHLGLRGVKMHPDFLKIPIDDKGYMPIYELCSEHGLPVCLHTGDHRYDYTNPNRLAPLAKRFPNLKIIAAHFGGYTVWEDAVKILPDIPNIFVDSSSSLPFLEPKRAREIARAYGASRILFGTDYPMWKPDKELERLARLELDPEELELIYHKNAENLLGLFNN